MRRARDNPFAVSRVLAQRYRLRGASWAQLWLGLRERGWRGALVGPHGSGKTTLLEDFEAPLREAGFRTHWIRLDEDCPKLPPPWRGRALTRLDDLDFLLVDGAELLSKTEWWRFRRGTAKAGGLLVTSHAPGLLPTLHECATDAELLADVIESLLGTRDHPCVRNAASLFEQYGGNLRDCLRELYDRWAVGSFEEDNGNPCATVERSRVAYEFVGRSVNSEKTPGSCLG